MNYYKEILIAMRIKYTILRWNVKATKEIDVFKKYTTLLSSPLTQLIILEHKVSLRLSLS